MDNLFVNLSARIKKLYLKAKYTKFAKESEEWPDGKLSIDFQMSDSEAVQAGETPG